MARRCRKGQRLDFYHCYLYPPPTSNLKTKLQQVKAAAEHASTAIHELTQHARARESAAHAKQSLVSKAMTLRNKSS